MISQETKIRYIETTLRKKCGRNFRIYTYFISTIIIWLPPILQKWCFNFSIFIDIIGKTYVSPIDKNLLISYANSLASRSWHQITELVSSLILDSRVVKFSCLWIFLMEKSVVQKSKSQQADYLDNILLQQEVKDFRFNFSILYKLVKLLPHFRHSDQGVCYCWSNYVSTQVFCFCFALH